MPDPDPNQNTNGISSIAPPQYQGPNYNAGNTTNGPGSNWRGNSPSWDPMNGGQDPTGGKMTVGQGQQYGDIYGQAGNMSNYFNKQAANYNQNAPQIGDVSQLAEAQKYYHDLMAGDGGYAQNQFRQSQDQSIATQMAMANSARGGAAAHAGALRAAQQGAGVQTAAGANQAAQIAMQEEQQGAQGMSQIGTLQLQRGSQNAQLQQNNQAQINQMMTALYGMGEQEQGLGLSAQQAYMANLLAAEGMQTQQSQFNTNLGVQVGGAAMQGIAGGIGAAASDYGLKQEIQPQGRGGIASIDYSKAISNPAPPKAPDNGAAVGTGAGVGAATGALQGASAGPVGAALGAVGGAVSGGLGAAHGSRPDDTGLKAANAATSAGMGAAGGAALGAGFGPIGAGVGGVIGGIGGLIKGLLT